jgi:endonuclease III
LSAGPDAEAFAGADRAELEEAVRPTGFYKQKARSVQETCRALVDRFGGEVPRSIAELITLPGVARKTANVVLATCFDIPSGIIVDTHVQRVSQRMGLTQQRDPERIETDLMASCRRISGRSSGRRWCCSGATCARRRSRSAALSVRVVVPEDRRRALRIRRGRGSPCVRRDRPTGR